MTGVHLFINCRNIYCNFSSSMSTAQYLLPYTHALYPRSCLWFGQPKAHRIWTSCPQWFTCYVFSLQISHVFLPFSVYTTPIATLSSLPHLSPHVLTFSSLRPNSWIMANLLLIILLERMLSFKYFCRCFQYSRVCTFHKEIIYPTHWWYISCRTKI